MFLSYLLSDWRYLLNVAHLAMGSRWMGSIHILLKRCPSAALSSVCWCISLPEGVQWSLSLQMNEASWHESPGPPEMRYFPVPHILTESASSVPPDCTAELSNDGSRIHSVPAAFLDSALCCILINVWDKWAPSFCASLVLITLAVCAQFKALRIEENRDSAGEKLLGALLSSALQTLLAHCSCLETASSGLQQDLPHCEMLQRPAILCCATSPKVEPHQYQVVFSSHLKWDIPFASLSSKPPCPAGTSFPDQKTFSARKTHSFVLIF